MFWLDPAQEWENGMKMISLLAKRPRVNSYAHAWPSPKPHIAAALGIFAALTLTHTQVANAYTTKTETQQILPTDLEAGDHVGGAVAIDGTTAIVSAGRDGAPG